MSTTQSTTVRSARSSAPSSRALAIGLIVVVLGVIVACALSLAVGARSIDLTTVWHALTAYDATNPDHVTIVDKRLARTLLGVLAGVALGLGGTVTQGLTRNPLADPGILGINTGAALGVVLSVTLLGVSAAAGYVWFAFAGAAVAAAVVFGIAALSRDRTPVTLALVGAAVAAALTSIVAAVLLTHQAAFEQVRFWQVGSLAGRGFPVLWGVLPTAVVGVIVAFAMGSALNGLALGRDLARGLGQRVGMTTAFGAAAIVLLCGSATAAVGPLTFVGLVLPHIARRITGPDYRWILPYAALLGPILLLVADVIGRVAGSPGEIEVGIIVALLGAPVFIALVRRRRAVSL